MVRLGSSAESGHFVTLIAFPQEQHRPVIVIDTLTGYTLGVESRYSEYYLNHLYKV